MPISKIVKKLLQDEGAPYKVVSHSEAFTAQATAGALHIPGKEVIKAVCANADEMRIMVVLPATHRIDFEKLKVVAGVQHVSLLTEEEVGQLLADFPTGAAPPFGHLYGMLLYMDAALETNTNVAFNGGDHTTVVLMRYADYKRIAKPLVIAKFSSHLSR